MSEMQNDMLRYKSVRLFENRFSNDSFIQACYEKRSFAIRLTEEQEAFVRVVHALPFTYDADQKDLEVLIRVAGNRHRNRIEDAACEGRPVVTAFLCRKIWRSSSEMFAALRTPTDVKDMQLCGAELRTAAVPNVAGNVSLVMAELHDDGTLTVVSKIDRPSVAQMN